MPKPDRIENVIILGKEVVYAETLPYGKLITIDEAEETVRRVPAPGGKPLGNLFLEVYRKYIKSETQIAVRFRDFDILKWTGERLGLLWSLDYLIGKSSRDDRVEITLVGGQGIMHPVLMVGLEYDGNDVDFQPRVPSFLYKLAEKLKIVSNRTNFQLFCKEYGTSITPDTDLTMALDVKDEKLGELATEMSNDLQNIIQKTIDSYYRHRNS